MNNPGSQGRDPLVSTIIPAYNVAPFLGEALRSVFCQDFLDYEVIVVDDGSTDDILGAIEPFLDRLKYIRQDNRGAAAARNRGIAVARGRWLAFLDGDDVWYPGFLSRQLQEAERRALDLVWCDGRIVGESLHAGHRLMEGAPCSGPVTAVSLVDATVNVFTSSVVVRRDSVLAVGGFDERIRRAQDFDLWVRMAHAGAKMGWSDAVMFSYRVRQGSITGGALDQVERELEVLEPLPAKLVVDQQLERALGSRLTMLRAQRQVELAKEAIRHGAFADARRHLAASRLRSLKIYISRLLLVIAPKTLQSALRRFRHPLER